MLVSSVTDVYGNALDAEDYDVLYFKDSNGDGSLDDGEPVVPKTEAVAGDASYPTGTGSFFVAVFKDGVLDELATTYGWDKNYSGWAWNSILETAAHQKTYFKVTSEAANKFEGLVACEGTDATDTEFKYNGSNITVNFALDGTILTEGTHYDVVWEAPAGVTSVTGNQIKDAGTYVANIYGKGVYAGSQAKIEVTVDPIDLSKDVIAVKTVNDTTGYGLGAAPAAIDDTFITVNGEPVPTNTALLTATCVKYEDATGNVTYNPGSVNAKGIYTFQVAADYNGGSNKNVIGGPIEVTGLVVDNVVKFYYDNSSNEIATDFSAKTFTLADGESFNPARIKAYSEADTGKATALKYTYKVTKDGKEVSTFDEPGTYVLELDCALADGFSYAGHEVVSFVVRDVDPADLTYDVFVSFDGKAPASDFFYTGQAYVPQVAVVNQTTGEKLVEGTDYALVYESNGEKVDSMVDAGTYDIVVDFAREGLTDYTAVSGFQIKKATLAAAKADQAVYAYTGEAVEPTFTVNTESDWSGASFAVDSKTASVKYYKYNETTQAYDISVNAKDLVAKGKYIAKVSTSASMPNYSGTDLEAEFQISEQAAFSDVAADAWYANAVYAAAQSGFDADGTTPNGLTDFRYMTGIEGTKLFMPEALITRAEVAQVFFNMAGGEKDAAKEYPTKFSDVDQAAWYAQAISWASTAGVVTGYDDGVTFGTFDNATREQVATMIYRYAKAQGLDVTVEDEAAALAKYVDGASVSEYAKAAMAWCIEQGVFGVGVDSLRPQDNLTRAEMAATAVRVQPDGRKQAL